MRIIHHHLLLLALLLIVSSSLMSISTCWFSIIIHQHSVSALTTKSTHVGHHSIQKTSSYFSTSLSAHTTSPTDSDYWANYSLRQSYKKAGGILYKQAILTPAEFSALRDAIDDMLLQDTLKLTDEKSSSFATNRMGAVIEKDSDVYQILSAEGGSLCRLVNCLVEEDEDEETDGNNEGEELGEMILSPDIPIEIRIYEKPKAGMEWHVDDIIYQNTKQIEVVLTLENTSDCCTMWRPHDQPVLPAASTTSKEEDDELSTSGSIRREQENNNSSGNEEFRVESVQTTPNSAILIKAGGVLHKVSPLSYGRRVILKMAFVREGALMSEEMRNHVSHHNGSSSASKKKDRRRKKKKR